ncbi:GDYXXLXY domain-containing protein [Hyphomicrobium sp. 1Nfss2.1]|uniref:GDYXXLXY domain-containing protein n=1 Tax=Hyphomicrobium sp. 1Nfss2.1 TaxID=3413936 RepID=UPI003C7AF4EC
MTTERRNLWAAIAAVALGQAAVLGWMIWDRVSLLANGREVVLEVIPVDPRSLFRGDYVILGYDISRYTLPPGTKPPKRNAPFYVTLKKGAGETWQAVAGGTEPPQTVQPDEVVIQGRVDYTMQATSDKKQEPVVVALQYGIESFFVPEGAGRELEKMVGEKKISALIAIDADGQAAIKGLMSDGKRVYDEPLL